MTSQTSTAWNNQTVEQFAGQVFADLSSVSWER
jgi:hypothetical protein